MPFCCAQCDLACTVHAFCSTKWHPPHSVTLHVWGHTLWRTHFVALNGILHAVWSHTYGASVFNLCRGSPGLSQLGGRELKEEPSSHILRHALTFFLPDCPSYCPFNQHPLTPLWDVGRHLLVTVKTIKSFLVYSGCYEIRMLSFSFLAQMLHFSSLFSFSFQKHIKLWHSNVYSFSCTNFLLFLRPMAFQITLRQPSASVLKYNIIAGKFCRCLTTTAFREN